MDVSVKFLGAAGTVTGSCYLIQVGDFKFLFDCGLFQGLKELRLRNWNSFPINPSEIQAVVISHAHIDHTGCLPKLVKEGYHGPIYCTEPTADLMKMMLLDSAKLQEEEAAFAKKRGYSRHSEPQPLYSTEHAKRVFPLVNSFAYNTRIKIHDRVEIVFHNAGHMLGAAITEVFIRGNNEVRKIVFSGDLGRYHDALLVEPSAITEADVLFIESTYGNRDNPATNPELELSRIVNETFFRKGILLIPAFAVGRTQELLFYLHKLMDGNKIPDVPVYVDSPMAISATYLHAKYENYQRLKLNSPDLFSELETNMLVFVKSADHSKSLNDLKGNAIIIAASGMMSGGRILHHLYHRLPKSQDTLLISGYQADGTRGRKLLEGAPFVRIFGDDVPVKCVVENMTSLSGHADRSELFTWMNNFKKAPTLTFAVHGEGDAIREYAKAIRDQKKWNVVEPNYLESFTIFREI